MTGVRAQYVNRQIARKTGWGPKVAITGDSKAAGSSDQSVKGYAGAWPMWFGIAADAQVYMPYNGAHGGYSSTDLLAVFDAEVLAQSPDVVIEDMGTNDVLDGLNHATTTIANLTEIHRRCVSRGIAFVMTTLTPSGVTVLPTPAAPTATVEATGGTMSASSPQYKIVYGNAIGATLASDAVTAVIASGSTNAVLLEVPYHPGVGIYSVYKSIDAGSTWGRIAQVLNIGNNPLRWYYRDTGTAPDTALSLPGSNTTASTATATARRKILTINEAKKRYAVANDVPLVDIYSLVTDSASGKWKVGYTADGTHPARLANKLIGEYVWSELAPFFRQRVPLGSLDNADPNNLHHELSGNPNGMLQIASGDPTAAFGWAFFGGSSSGVSTSLGPRAGHRGNAQGVTRTIYDSRFSGPTGAAIASVTPGHVYGCTARFELDGGDNGATGNLSFGWFAADGTTGLGYAFSVSLDEECVPKRIDAWPMAAPANAAYLRLQANLGDQRPASIYVSEIFIYDLTAMGIA